MIFDSPHQFGSSCVQSKPDKIQLFFKQLNSLAGVYWLLLIFLLASLTANRFIYFSQISLQSLHSCWAVQEFFSLRSPFFKLENLEFQRFLALLCIGIGRLKVRRFLWTFRCIAFTFFIKIIFGKTTFLNRWFMLKGCILTQHFTFFVSSLLTKLTSSKHILFIYINLNM